MHPAPPRSTILLPGALLAWALLLSAPRAHAQAPATPDGFKGQGAALCIAAGEMLAEERGADAGIPTHVLAWRQVLHVVDGTEARRQAALESARASLTPAAGAPPARATTAARALWSTTCATREMQVRYISVHGSDDRIVNHLASEPGAALGAEAVRRLNVSASCLVAAEMLAQRRPSRTLRAAFAAADPRVPDAAVLDEIQARARQEVEGAPGSAVGKALVVDHLRHVYEVASGGRQPQPFVNFATRLLHERCQAGAAS